jgi:C1A family cysteine protease
MAPAQEVFDGHSVLLVGFKDDPAQPGGGVFLVRNSGGGVHDGAMLYGYVRDYMNDAAWIEPAPGKGL